jgi:hypothetical protein
VQPKVKRSKVIILDPKKVILSTADLVGLRTLLSWIAGRCMVPGKASPSRYKTADSSPLAAAAGQYRNAESKQLVL